MFKKTILISSLISMLVGCASAETEKRQQLEGLAKYRAGILASDLPIEMGAITMIQAKAKHSTVELHFLEANEGKISLQKLVDTSENTYCNDQEIRPLLSQGISYRIIVRSNRGQLKVDHQITEQTCVTKGF
ncbi:MAG: type II secretion system pilot lipoprotein GspS-beta [Aliivibrio sp.]|uniref:type II secretion system pilot lipoprotein GspS-beta n=1 Tax=Aliivibrio sp. TaxID=1872443 RepID=UPI001A425128|nr:type II secretion system pilot lipoprotein GspS-beta [Aliivibrio sp.]